jgi:hypothetical protein
VASQYQSPALCASCESNGDLATPTRARPSRPSRQARCAARLTRTDRACLLWLQLQPAGFSSRGPELHAERSSGSRRLAHGAPARRIWARPTGGVGRGQRFATLPSCACVSSQLVFAAELCAAGSGVLVATSLPETRVHYQGG